MSYIEKNNNDLMVDIIQSMNELNEIHQNLQSALEKQSNVIDTIEYNMDNSDTYVLQSTNELIKANTYSNNTKKWTLVGIISTICLTLGIRLIH